MLSKGCISCALPPSQAEGSLPGSTDPAQPGRRLAASRIDRLAFRLLIVKDQTAMMYYTHLGGKVKCPGNFPRAPFIPQAVLSQRAATRSVVRNV